ncbi:MFS transporter, partial [Mesonia sp.]|uniref:MFS transporter n=1 Tax=Mesonia sp. TaxID=1960830 RepID=UPI0025B94935
MVRYVFSHYYGKYIIGKLFLGRWFPFFRNAGGGRIFIYDQTNWLSTFWEYRRSRRKKIFISTFLIGCIPNFATIGWAAPILLLVFRLLQGLAISGEYAGAVIYVAEHAPKEKRGFYTGFIQATVPVGLLICLMVVYIVRSSMSAEDFVSYGWRIPFLLSSVLVILSYFARKKLHESPVFEELKSKGKTSKSPIKDAFKAKGNIA